MTFCLGMKLDEGLIAIADTQLTAGTERTTARKVTVHEYQRHNLFLMTSGLRSVRDKVLTYFDEILSDQDGSFDKLYKAANAFSTQVRRVAEEDGDWLRRSNISFNLHAIIGGQLKNDKEHKLYLIYPEGNWVESTVGSPYYIIGESGYGKPILDRALTFYDNLQWGLKVGYLAFDGTHASATDVGFPLDVVLYRKDSFKMAQHRFERKDFADISDWWMNYIRKGVNDLPDEWMQRVFHQLVEE
jgi:putative proteasome-type protease